MNPASRLFDTKKLEATIMQLEKRRNKMTQEGYSCVRLFKAIKESIKTLIRSIEERRWLPTETHRNEKFARSLSELKEKVKDLTDTLKTAREQLQTDTKDEEKVYRMDFLYNLKVASSLGKVFRLLRIDILDDLQNAQLSLKNQTESNVIKQTVEFSLLDCARAKDENAKKFADKMSEKIHKLIQGIENFQYETGEGKILSSKDCDSTSRIGGIKSYLTRIDNEIQAKPSISNINKLVILKSEAKKARDLSYRDEKNTGTDEYREWEALSSNFEKQIDGLKTLVADDSFPLMRMEEFVDSTVSTVKEDMKKRIDGGQESGAGNRLRIV